MDRTHGYAPKGEPVEGRTHGKKTEKLNIVGAKCGDKILHKLNYNTFHREKVLRSMAEAVGCHVLFLPKYSPDLNPIEHEWANLKTFLRNHGRNYASTAIAVYHYFLSA